MKTLRALVLVMLSMPLCTFAEIADRMAVYKTAFWESATVVNLVKDHARDVGILAENCEDWGGQSVGNEVAGFLKVTVRCKNNVTGEGVSIIMQGEVLSTVKGNSTSLRFLLNDVSVTRTLRSK